MRTRFAEITYSVLVFATSDGREPADPALDSFTHGQALFAAEDAVSGHDPATAS